MPESSQANFSTNWKPACELSKPVQMNSEMMKVNAVVNSAMARMLRRAFSLSSLMNRISSTPTSGRKVTSERIGQAVIRASSR